jgi:hypothetical protein
MATRLYLHYATYLNPPGVQVVKIASMGEITQCGIGHFRIECPDQPVTINEGHHRAFSLSGITDGWARNIEIFNTVNSINATGKRLTIEDIHIEHNLFFPGVSMIRMACR